MVCLKERNLLLTQMAWAQRADNTDQKDAYAERYKNVSVIGVDLRLASYAIVHLASHGTTESI